MVYNLMGNCCTGTFPEILDTVEYEGCVTIKIKVRENRRNQVVGRDIVRFNLEPPTNQKNESYDFDYLHFFVSSCVLPGLDPRRAEHRECQDSLFFIVESDKILLGLFDGHGKYGTQVVDFCCKYMKTYFKNNHEDFETSPESSLEEMVKSCDEKIRSSKDEVNCSTSGTTALLVYIDRTGIHIASVGDSRSILGTRSDIPPDQRDRSSSKNSYLRKIDAGIQLNVLTLSVDQKPNHETEYERIKSCNGIVEQITDDFGNKAGPYRVWDKNGRGQGLAMSRSIGDQLSKNLGVISEPVYNHFDYIPSRDKFIVMASDGVWDVMDNDEVVSFVEKFRKKCAKRHQDPNYPHKV
jgi:serine/threonine protein phosphatase PrpC